MGQRLLDLPQCWPHTCRIQPLTVFAVNHLKTESAVLDIDLSEFSEYGFAEHQSVRPFPHTKCQVPPQKECPLDEPHRRCEIYFQLTVYKSLYFIVPHRLHRISGCKNRFLATYHAAVLCGLFRGRTIPLNASGHKLANRRKTGWFHRAHKFSPA